MGLCILKLLNWMGMIRNSNIMYLNILHLSLLSLSLSLPLSPLSLSPPLSLPLSETNLKVRQALPETADMKDNEKDLGSFNGERVSMYTQQCVVCV